MFEYIKGVITYIAANYVVIESNSIGFNIKTANPYVFTLNEEVVIHIYTYVREDTFDLYGFKKIEEKNLFMKLIMVKGIGPKGALAIIASGDILGLQNAIANGDSKYLQKFPGIGPKASGQIILDLKGKLVDTNVNPKINNVKEALKSLGFNNNELRKLDTFLNENIDLPIEQLVSLSLKKLF